MSEPVLKEADARAALLSMRLKELLDHVRSSRRPNAVGIISHLDEDIRQLELVRQAISQSRKDASE